MSGRTLTATSLPRFVSIALYTSPMPPTPICEVISYGPILEPAPSALRESLYGFVCLVVSQKPEIPTGPHNGSPRQVCLRRQCPVDRRRSRLIFQSRHWTDLVLNVADGRCTDVRMGAHSSERCDELHRMAELLGTWS